MHFESLRGTLYRSIARILVSFNCQRCCPAEMQRACAATDRQAGFAHQNADLEHACSMTGRQARLPAPWPSETSRTWCESAPRRRRAPRLMQCNGLEDGRYNADLARLMDGPDVTLFRFPHLPLALCAVCNLHPAVQYGGQYRAKICEAPPSSTVTTLYCVAVVLSRQ